MVDGAERESVGTRLTAARARAFVGRQAPIDLFCAALEDDEPSFSVMHVHGPGGIGKTTLVRRLIDEARARGVPVSITDAHAIHASESSLLAALGADDLASLVAHVTTPRAVLVIDTYELLAPLDAFVREVLAPALPLGTLLVLAGREPPSAAWRQDPGWTSLLRPIALRNLSESESARLLASRGVPATDHAAIHALTYGHPLALALLADLRREGSAELPTLTADVLGPLLVSLLRTLPSDRHRDALELAALARVVDGSLVRELADDHDGSLFAWLRTLSFIDTTHEGLFVHDLVREALLAEALLRAPDALHARRMSLVQRVSRRLLGPGARRERLVLDLLHNYRADPMMRRFFGWNVRLDGSARAMRPGELDALVQLAATHEGESAAAVARRLHAARPDAFVTLESAGGETLGFLVYVRFDRAQLASLVALDPSDTVTQSAARVLESHGSLRHAEQGALLRFWLWTRDYQGLGAEAHTAHSMYLALHWASAPALGPVVVVAQNADLWTPFLANIAFLPTRQPDVAFGGHSYRLFLRDFRRDPMVSPDAERRAPHHALSREDFVAAAREAFRSARRAIDLARSPLLGSRVMLDWAEGEPPSGEMLVELLKAATTSLDHADERARRAVELTYFEGLSQQAGAERLGLTFVTYRRQLVRGVDAVIEWLWEREVRGS